MHKATAKDKADVFRILKPALDRDPHTNWYVTGNTNVEKNRKKYESFLGYNFKHALLDGEVCLSDDGNGCALWVNYGQKRKPGRMFHEDLRFLARFGLGHTLSVLRLQKKIADSHKYKKFLHLLYIGVHPEHQGKGIAGSLMKPVLSDAEKQKMPVLLETSTQTNVKIYTKLGFSLYHTLKVAGTEDLQIYFMERNAANNAGAGCDQN